MNPAQRGPESGYALLALLASSAILLAALALSIPRMAMQAQRVKDTQVIERGKQYERAIKLYYREHKKYPEELDDLEETDGVRYLRRRYKDPLSRTGEWRLIHMGEDGRFEDSLLYDLEDEETSRQTAGFQGGGFGGQGARLGSGSGGLGGGATGMSLQSTAGIDQSRMQREMQQPQSLQGPAVGPNRASIARESAAPDLVAATRYSQGFGFDPNAPEPPDADGIDVERLDRAMMLPSAVPMDENDPFQRDPFDPYRIDRRGRNPTASQFGAFGPGRFPGDPATQEPPGAPRGAAEGAVAANQAGLAAGSGAAAVVNRLLTTPRGRNSQSQFGPQQPGATVQVFERGIAGVASQGEGAGVRRYNGKETYVEWEFVYDYRKGTDGPEELGGSVNAGVPLDDALNRQPIGGSRGRKF